MVPGQDLVVSRTPHKAKKRYTQPDVFTSVRDSFEAAERQLKDFKEVQRGDVKPHETVVVFNTGAATKYLESLPVELPTLDKDRIDWDALA